MPDDPLRRLLANPPDLPVRVGLDALLRAVEQSGTAVLQAPPGAGKTTLVPPALALAVPGRVVVTQPRRLAARAAARRLASLLGEPVGATVGYAVRGERHVGRDTRIEVVTTGILLRRLQGDPELAGVSTVVLDEVHERHLDADLTLALLVDVRTHLREDLRLVAMSATIEAERTAMVLGRRPGVDGPAPVVQVPGAIHPVTTHWCPPPPRVQRTDHRGVTPAYLDHVAGTVRRALAEADGDVLVFVPGAGEVAGVARRLAGSGVDVRPLHGRLGSREQDAALTPGTRRRVVVSTAVAESSVTVPGVRVVVDAGLARQPRTDHRRGLAGLVTVLVSRAGAEQRGGRAGREGPGTVYRCWSQLEDSRLAAHPEPEIATADLTSFALELACWGAPGGAGLALVDQPPAAALAVAHQTLLGLGAVDADGTVTPRGRAVARIGADPRLARALLDAAPLVGRRRAAEVVALLEDDVRAPGADLAAALRSVRRDAGQHGGQQHGGQHGGGSAAAWSRSVDRLLAQLPTDRVPGRGTRAPSDLPRSDDLGLSDDLATGLVAALAHPDRVARQRGEASTYLMAGGTGATLPPGSPLLGAPWLAVADADRRPGHRDATIRAAAPLDEDLARLAAASLLHDVEEVTWSDGALSARSATRLGAIELAGRRLENPAPHLVATAVRDGLAREGLALLSWTAAATGLRERMAFLHRTVGEPWPDVSDAALLAGVETWLAPELAGLARARGARRSLRGVPVVEALRRLLPWPEASRLDELAPERVQVPSGSTVRVDYSGDQPTLAVRVQEVFGWAVTPRIAGGRVPLLLHLLSPAGRPAAVTADLDSFWDNGYPQVRADLRGRYPKHSWPPDGRTAPPTRRVRPPSR